MLNGIGGEHFQLFAHSEMPRLNQVVVLTDLLQESLQLLCQSCFGLGLHINLASDLNLGLEQNWMLQLLKSDCFASARVKANPTGARLAGLLSEVSEGGSRNNDPVTSEADDGGCGMAL